MKMILQCWRSNGKCLTSSVQYVFITAGNIHKTLPSLVTMLYVSMKSRKLSSALQCTMEEENRHAEDTKKKAQCAQLQYILVLMQPQSTVKCQSWGGAGISTRQAPHTLLKETGHFLLLHFLHIILADHLILLLRFLLKFHRVWGLWAFSLLQIMFLATFFPIFWHNL